MRHRKGLCSSCRKETWIVKRLPSGILCRYCNDKRLQERKEKWGAKLKPPALPEKKPSGELSLFRAIWAARPHVSFISGLPIKDFAPIHFFHILGKGAYPSYKLYDKNIILATEQEHVAWHTGRHKLKGLPEWEKVFLLYEELKEEYEMPC